MRPNQQSKRSRNRNSGRKSVNPLSRNFESNGPDVKIRGNAAHVAEKYVQLARDAQASGDSVMAENYFQHAEHYFRILSAAQAQNPGRPDQVSGGFGAADRDMYGDDDGDEADDADNRDERPAAHAAGGGGEQQPAEAAAESQPAVDPNGGDDAKPEEPRRVRRPRRKPREAAEAQGADPGNAPQPELPAFITAGGQAAAE